jgi:hypothetical protein
VVTEGEFPYTEAVVIYREDYISHTAAFDVYGTNLQ